MKEVTMRYWDAFRKLLAGSGMIFSGRNEELQPRDIMLRLFAEMEKRRKYGIEEKAYVPNSYTIYLSPYDYEEISPLLAGIREQLHIKLMDRIKKKGYKLLSLSLIVDIRGDSGLLKSQIVVESSFLKEKSLPGSPQSKSAEVKKSDITERRIDSSSMFRSVNKDDRCRDVGGQIEAREGNRKEVPSFEASLVCSDISSELKQTVHQPGGTKIIEDRKTKLVDAGRVRLEIVKEDGPGDVIILKEGEYTFGRGRDAQYLLEDTEDTVSRKHFRLIVRDSRVRIKDLSSLNGTRVNDIAIDEAELQKGDLISAGNILLRVA
jgi:hypothetical protein